MQAHWHLKDNEKIKNDWHKVEAKTKKIYPGRSKQQLCYITFFLEDTDEVYVTFQRILYWKIRYNS